jgi:hypothetical protein
MIRAMKVFGVMSAAFLTLVLLPSPVMGDPWGTGTSATGDHPDGGNHTYCYAAGLSSALTANIQYAENTSLAASTDASVSKDTPCIGDAAAQTDVVWFSSNGLENGVRGRTQCMRFNPSTGYCDRNHVILDLAEINEGSNDGYDQTKTACHELGHTVGLTHGGSSDCMLNGERPSTATQYQNYNAHHRGHINAWF